MSDSIRILSGGPELLDRISPLWEEIKKHHVEKSIPCLLRRSTEGKALGKNSHPWR